MFPVMNVQDLEMVIVKLVVLPDKLSINYMLHLENVLLQNVETKRTSSLLFLENYFVMLDLLQLE